MKYDLTIDGPQAHTVTGRQIAIVPVEVAADQKAYDGRTFPVLLIPSYGHRLGWNGKPRKARARLRGDLYGLHTPGTGDMVVSICN